MGTTEDVVGMIKKAREIEIAQQLADEEEEQAIEEELSIGHI